MAKAKKKGRAASGAFVVWLFFAQLFDPKKAAAIEHIDTQKRLGSEAARQAAIASAPIDPALPPRRDPGTGAP